jgi:hypothetical protein
MEFDREERRTKEDAMITPASVADWALFAGMMGSLSALAACGSRWVLQETPAPGRVRSHPYSAPRTVRERVST